MAKKQKSDAHPQAKLWTDAETVDAFSSPMLERWLREKAATDPAAFARLAGDNRERFARIWGPAPARSSQGDLVWVNNESGCSLFAASSEQGSRYKIHYVGGERDYAADRRMATSMSAFFERLLGQLSGG